MNAPDLRAAALEYAEQGFPVFPCNSGNKQPLTPNGFRDATADPATISDWWKRWPNAMIGMPTGEPSGVWVLDIDDPEAFAANAPHLPTTRKAITGKGYHYYWTMGALAMRNAQRHPKRGWPFPELPGAEVRGEGGYVILPPSRHPSGQLYEWADDCDPVAAPPELLHLMKRQNDNEPPAAEQPARRPLPDSGTGDLPYGLAALHRECEAILRANDGEQECALNEAALKIGSLVAGGELSMTTAKAQLLGAGLAMTSYDPRNPWTPQVIAEKVERGLADGADSPRSAPPRMASMDYQPAGGRTEKAEIDSPIESLDLVALSTVEPRPKTFVIPALAPAGELTLFTGPGSAGKSLWSQQVATALAAGVPTLGLQMGQAPAIYLTCEDNREELHWRQAHICAALGTPMESLSGQLHLVSLRGRLDNTLGTVRADGSFELSRSYKRLGAFIRKTGATLVVLDNLAHLFAGNENDRAEVTQFANALNRLAGESGAAIVLLGHTNKAFTQGITQGNAHSGSTAWVNAVRSQFVIVHDEKTDLRTITLGKANYARKGEVMRFVWQNGALVLESDQSPDGAREFMERTKAKAEDDAFLRCLAACTEQRRNVSHQTTGNSAPKTFARMVEAEGITKAGFQRAMERLLHAKVIEVDCELWTGGNRHKKRGIRLASEPMEGGAEAPAPEP